MFPFFLHVSFYKLPYHPMHPPLENLRGRQKCYQSYYHPQVDSLTNPCQQLTAQIQLWQNLPTQNKILLIRVPIRDACSLMSNSDSKKESKSFSCDFPTN